MKETVEKIDDTICIKFFKADKILKVDRFLVENSRVSQFHYREISISVSSQKNL